MTGPEIQQESSHCESQTEEKSLHWRNHMFRKWLALVHSEQTPAVGQAAAGIASSGKDPQQVRAAMHMVEQTTYAMPNANPYRAGPGSSLPRSVCPR